jgi:hypothetical protein
MLDVQTASSLTKTQDFVSPNSQNNTKRNTHDLNEQLTEEKDSVWNYKQIMKCMHNTIILGHFSVQILFEISFTPINIK